MIMKQKILFSMDHTQTLEKINSAYQQNLRDYLQKLTSDKQLFNQVLPFAQTLNDAQLLQRVTQVSDALQQHKPTIIVLVGIGGSNLGTQAIVELLHGFFYRVTHSPTLFFADTTDPVYIRHIIDQVTNALQKDDNVCLIGISKSGKTIEAVANLSVFIELLQTHKKDSWQNYCTFISDDGSPLMQYAQKVGAHTLVVPKDVSGRYSVFTAVGLLPLMLMGINIEQLLSGARSVVEQLKSGVSDDFVRSVAALFAYYESGGQLCDLFVFGHNFESYGKWWRQLVAESLAKEHDRDGQKITHSLVPTVSVGSVDLHSMAQLYLTGNAKQFTIFVTTDHENDYKIKPFAETITQQTSLGNIMTAAYKSTMLAYKEQQLPYTHVHLESLSIQTVGQLMMGDMVQTVLLAHLMNVDPFDQPHVELYKKHMRTIMSNS